MPEIFEVRRIRQYLFDGDILNSPIVSFSFKNNGHRILKSISEKKFLDLVINNQITSIQTKAKYTLFCLNDCAILLHYRFTGIPHIRGLPYGNRLKSIYSLPILNLNKKYIRFTIHFKNGVILDYYDTRCLSHMNIKQDALRFNDFIHISTLAPDLIDHKFPEFKEFKLLNKASNVDLKSYLLNQTKPPSGIGNYLANEICAYSKLDPWKQMSKITKTEYSRLINGVNQVIKHCQKNSSYEWFQVFNRNNCKECKNKIIKKRHKKGAQSTFYCEKCQKY